MEHLPAPQNEHEAPPERETTFVAGVMYDVRMLEPYAEEIPIEERSTEELRGAVGPGNRYWTDRDGHWFGPDELLHDWAAAKQHAAWTDHIATIERADCTKPIWIHGPTGTVFDGMHRLTRAFLDGRDTISVRVWDALPAAAVVDASAGSHHDHDRLADALAMVRPKFSPEATIWEAQFDEGHGDDPYVIERRDDTQELVFFGSVHTNDPAHPMISRIAAARDAFLLRHSEDHPLFLVEGWDASLNRDTAVQLMASRRIRDESDAVREFGEGGLLMWTGVKWDVELESPEASEDVIVADLIGGGVGRDDIALFLVLRQISQDIERQTAQSGHNPLQYFTTYFVDVQQMTGVQWIAPEVMDELRREAQQGVPRETLVQRYGMMVLDQFISALNDRFANYTPSTVPLIPSIDALLTRDKTTIAVDESEAICDPVDLHHRGTLINQIASAWGVARDRQILRALDAARRRRQSVFIVYGRSHAGSLEAAIDVLYSALR